MKKTIAIAIMMLTLGGCTDPQGAKEALQSQGFSDINITGYKMFMCSENDVYSTGFVAKNVNGQTVKGSVCSGVFFKGSTIRY